MRWEGEEIGSVRVASAVPHRPGTTGTRRKGAYPGPEPPARVHLPVLLANDRPAGRGDDAKPPLAALGIHCAPVCLLIFLWWILAVRPVLPLLKTN